MSAHALVRTVFVTLCLSMTACGAQGLNVVPELPGGGTANLPDLPQDVPEGEADPWAGKSDLIRPPVAVMPAAIDFGKRAAFKLTNGLNVVVIEDRRVPVVAMNLAVRAGRREEPAEKPGLAAFAAAVLPRGTRQRSGAQLAAAVRDASADFGTTASYDATVLRCAAAATAGDRCIRILAEVAQRPSMTAENVESVRQELKARLQRRRDDRALLASAHLHNAIWGESHPGGRATSQRALDAIARNDLVTWHRRWFRPQNSVLVIVGDVSAAAMKAVVSKSFAAWPRQNTPARSAEPEPATSGKAVRVVAAPAGSDVQVRLGFPAISSDDPGYEAALVAAELIGSPGGRLPLTAAKVLGPGYEASVLLETDRKRGALVAAMRAPKDRALVAVELIRAEMRALARRAPEPEEVALAASRIFARWSSQLEHRSELASAMAASRLRGGGFERLSQFGARLAKVTPEAVKKAAEKFEPGGATIVVVGDPKILAEQLEKASLAYQVVAAVPVSDRERQLAGAAAERPEISAADAKAAAAILKQAVAAKGGAARLQKLKTLAWKGTATVELPRGTVKGEIEKHLALPSKLRLDMHLIDLKIKATTVIDGETAWGQEDSPGGQSRVFELPADEAALVKETVWRDQDLVLLRALDEGATARPLADHKIDGSAHHAIELFSRDGTRRVILYIDKKSFHLAGMVYGDGPNRTVESFGNYKRVGGVLIAHRRKSTNPQLTLTAELVSAEVDKKIGDELFRKPDTP